MQLFANRYPSPQPFLPPLATVAWSPARQLPRYAARRRVRSAGVQLLLFPLAAAPVEHKAVAAEATS